MNSAQDVLNGGLLTPFTVARPSPPTTKEGAAAQREEKLKEQERAAAGRRMATQSLEETKRAQRRQLEGAEAYRTRQLMEIEGERPLPVSLPEFQSPRKTGEEMIGLLLVNAFATSALGKQNYLAAANAMTGAIRGYEAGKKTEYEQALKDFDVAVRKAVQEDKVNTAKYLQIANSKKMSVQDKFNLMRQEALRLDDKIMAAQLNTQQWDKVVAEVDRRLTAIDNTEREINREERRRVERAEERAERRAERAVDRAERGATGRTAQTWEVTDEQGKKRNISVMPQYDRQGRQTNEPAGGVLLGTGARAGATAAPSAAVIDERGMFTIDPKQLPKGKTSDEFNAREPILGAISDLNYLINKKDEKGVANKDKMGYVFQALSLNPTLNLPVLTTYYKNDPDMLAIIRRLGQFESQEFQIGGKALTVNERNVLQPIYGWRGTNVNALLGQTELALQELDEKQKVITSQYSEAKKARRNMQINLGRGKSKDNPIILDSEDDAGGLPAGTFVRVDKSIFKVREE